MLEVAVRVILGGVLAWASLAKLASPRSSRVALASFGVAAPRAQTLAWGALVAAELALAGGVIAGSDAAAFGAAGLMALFALTMGAALLGGRAGAPCACFGARSTITPAAVARNLALAGAFAALPLLPSSDLSTDQWLALGLGLALLGCAALGVAVLALAREVGVLRLRLGPAGALEIAAEGPPLGSRPAIPEVFAPAPQADLALAVFTSQGCRVCRGLEPAIASLAREPELAVSSFDEELDAGVWEELEIPGSPYAVAVDRAGRVLAKGTFNNLAQLESLIASARRRAADAPERAAALAGAARG